METLTGRQEVDSKFEEKINNLLFNQPNAIKQYSKGFGSRKSTRTKYTYISNVSCFVRWLDDNNYINTNVISDYNLVKKSNINEYLDYMKGKGYKNSSLIPVLASINNFFQFLVDDEYITSNPCDKVEKPKDNSNHEVVSLTPDEVKLIKTRIKEGYGSGRCSKASEMFITRDLAIVSLGFNLGLRISAIRELNYGDVDFKNNCINVILKGNKPTQIYFGKELADELRDCMVDRARIKAKCETYAEDALFLSKYGNRISTYAISNLLIKYADGINKHITPHKMRSTCATNLYEATNDIYLVQNQLKHQNISSTMRYAKVSNERAMKGVETLEGLY